MSLVYEIFDLHINAKHVVTVSDEEIAKELCRVRPSLVFRPLYVADTFFTAIDEIKKIMREDVDGI